MTPHGPHCFPKLLFASLLGALSLAACEESPGGGSQTTDTGDTDTAVSVGGELASGPVGSGGGEVRVTTGDAAGAAVTVEPGSLASEVELTISAGADIASPGLAAAGPAIAFGPAGTTFATPVVVTLPWDPTAGDAATLVVLHRPDGGAVETLTPVHIDASAGLVRVEAWSFSTFQAAVAGCPTGQRDCGAGCVDVTANDDHCGDCHRACGLARECVASECHDVVTEWPDDGQVLIDGVLAMNLAVNSESLYFNDTPYLQSTRLVRAAKESGTTEVLPHVEGVLGADDDALYTSASGYLMRHPTAGGEPVILSDQAGTMRARHLTATHLWWARAGSGFHATMFTVDLTTGTEERQFGPLDTEGAFDVRAGTAYWSNTAPAAPGIKRWSPGDVQYATISDERSSLGVATDDAHVYWIGTVSEVGAFSTQRVARAPLGGGETTYLASELDGIAGFVVDATHVYLLRNGTSVRALQRLPKVGGQLETLVRNRWAAGWLIQDATHVYFATRDGDISGDIKRVAK